MTKYINIMEKKGTLDILEKEQKISFDLKKEGLLLLGSQHSAAPLFLFNYIKELSENEKIILITREDFMFPMHKKIINELETFTNEKKIRNKCENIYFEELYDNDEKEYSADLTIIKLKDIWKHETQKEDLKRIQKRNDYFPSILKQISKQKDSIVILNNCIKDNIEIETLSKYIELFKSNNIGVIISNHNYYEVNGVDSQIDNNIIFHVKDPLTEFGYHKKISTHFNKLREDQYIFQNLVYFPKRIDKSFKLSNYFSLNIDLSINKVKNYKYIPFIFFKNSTEEYINNLEYKISIRDKSRYVHNSNYKK